MKLRPVVAALTALVILPALVTLPAFAAEEVYQIDTAHSRPMWEVRHLGMSNQRGSFQKSSSKVTLDRAAKKGSVEWTIDATSVRTFDDRLDTAVKGEKFFNVEKFPSITFKSTNLAFDGDRVVGIDGDLTMLGVTKPVSFKVADFKCGEQAMSKKPMCGGEASATIKRSDFGMTANLPFAPADEVKLIVPVEAYLQQG